ncbi:hypothetical protein J4208_02345 [Candidatus Woesearchaeota archaeon]|nr:hypothetical protein [Candidatus Woesearchaeota archaeon]
MTLDLATLAQFLVRAKLKTYASDGAEVPANQVQRPGFKELVHREGDLEYRDSYTGFYRAPGQELVRVKEQPFWSMSYDGGMLPTYHGNLAFTKQTFAHLKRALSLVPISLPFRGPSFFREGSFTYTFEVHGDITDFYGLEAIHHDDIKVFQQRCMGGLILPKNLAQSL